MHSKQDGKNEMEFMTLSYNHVPGHDSSSLREEIDAKKQKENTTRLKTEKVPDSATKKKLC